MPRQDCKKVPEQVCKPEARVEVVEETEEVCDQEVAVVARYVDESAVLGT